MSTLSERAYIFQLVTGVAAGAGAGTVTVALLGFGASTPDWKAVREDISDLINDPDVKNPSVDDGVQGKFSLFKALIQLDFLYVRFRMTFNRTFLFGDNYYYVGFSTKRSSVLS